MKKILFSMLVLIGCLCLAGIAQADLFSGFASDTEGWTTEGATSPTFVATGGNPDGYIKATDSESTWWRFVSPSSWDGDWSGYSGGTIQFDLKSLTGNSNQYNHYVEIWSSGNYMWWEINIHPSKNTWTHFEVQLTDANFTEVGATFADILQNVTALKILGDIVNGTDTTGLDNVLVSAYVAPVPLPGAVWLLASGLFGFIGIRRRQD